MAINENVPIGDKGCILEDQYLTDTDTGLPNPNIHGQFS